MTDRVPVPPLLAQQWETASSRLFGSLVMDPDGYQRAVTVLGAVLAELRSRTSSTADLLAVADEVPALVTAASEAGPGMGVDTAAVAGAALAQRHRELVAHEDARDRAERLAGAGGSGWVLLEEVGDDAGDPLRPYRRVEADAATGRALVVRADPDEGYTGVVHRVERAQVDLASGALGPATEPDADSGALTDAAAREALADRWRGAPAPR